MTEVYTGKVVSKGIAIAPARKVALPPELVVPDHGIEDLKHEQVLFDKALAGARDYVSRWKATMNGRLEGEALELYDAYDEMLQDPELVIQTKDLIESSSKNAAHCFFRVTEDYATTLMALNDPYLSARSEDIRMLADLVIRLLSGQEIQELTWTDKAVIVSRQLTPQQLSSMNSDAIAGIVLVEGGLTDHTAILAQALSIPLLIGVSEQVLEIQNETPTLLDLEAGVFVVNPNTKQIHHAQEKLGVLQERFEQARLQATEKTVTKSGRSISVEANVGLPQTPRNKVYTFDLAAYGFPQDRTISSPSYGCPALPLCLERTPASRIVSEPSPSGAWLLIAISFDLGFQQFTGLSYCRYRQRVLSINTGDCSTLVDPQPLRPYLILLNCSFSQKLKSPLDYRRGGVTEYMVVGDPCKAYAKKTFFFAVPLPLGAKVTKVSESALQGSKE